MGITLKNNKSVTKNMTIKGDNGELVEELADLFYHLAVLLVNQGVEPGEVVAELERRSLKEGNLKAERKPIEEV